MRDLRFEAMCAHPAGKGIPESAEVAQARMDSEAVALANSGRPVRGVWLVAVGQVAGIVGLFLLVMVVTVLADVAGGWLL
ncbi:hypothetical protein NCCP2495_05820 [Dietzia sp. NCCP-2495]|uniref:hypothetical protein n=1 Tax=Dietzia sp. NCCP-2495 TaxID=2934675 RepID=UPI0022303B9B|nr:hypothetical protein [Dietzia sp. NCCP-2495]GLB62704.1 hypothetical protein NCCP2495_05820 [Dietzia sp. NCCP-2495]